MGWFSWLRKKVVEPVVEAVEEAAETFVEKVIEPVVEVVTTVVDTVVQTVTATVDKVVDAVTEAVGGAIEGASEAVFEATLNVADNIFENDYQPINPDLSRFEPVAALEDQVQSVTIDSNNMSAAEIVELRDATVAAQIGYADYSDLFEAGAVNIDGYVTDLDLFYAENGWLDGLVNWASDRFEIIRVLEDASSSLLGGFEANVTLTQNTETGEYFIGIGGTASLGDVISDISLVLGEDTGSSEDAITGMIAQFFEDDIADGAIVNLTGHSLGGAEAVLQYRDDPDLFDHVYAIQAVGIGGFDGTFYDRNIWDGVGDANITELTGDDAGTDFNDLVTSWGHIGAGTTYHIADVITAEDDGGFFRDLEVADSHLIDNVWASLPGGQDPVVPTTSDMFDFA
ncbi:hypothetical protein [Yoonia sp. 2307UL14-13]|uniref:hypothetical protein n=1 Tax=Yoonia sp. 2307UL14-13 TaxID=3126506 RepID=UPI0030AA7A9E